MKKFYHLTKEETGTAIIIGAILYFMFKSRQSATALQSDSDVKGISWNMQTRIHDIISDGYRA